MKFVKLLGFLVVVVFALMGPANSASATVLTSPTGGVVAAGATFHAVNVTTARLTAPVGEIECTNSTIKGTTSNTGSAVETVKANVSSFFFSGCNATVTVLKLGSLEIHTSGEAGGGGTVTGSGQELTILFSGFHCVFGTNNTHLGKYDNPTPSEPQHNMLTLTGKLPRIGGTSGVFCGSESVMHLTSTVLQLSVAGVTVTNVIID